MHNANKEMVLGGIKGRKSVAREGGRFQPGVNSQNLARFRRGRRRNRWRGRGRRNN